MAKIPGKKPSIRDRLRATKTRGFHGLFGNPVKREAENTLALLKRKKAELKASRFPGWKEELMNVERQIGAWEKKLNSSEKK